MSIRVLVVDDSPSTCALIAELVGMAGDIEVVGTTSNIAGVQAIASRLHPDLITLGLGSPESTDNHIIERLNDLRTFTVLVISAPGDVGSEAMLRALELGAVDFIARPAVSNQSLAGDFAAILTDKIRAAANSQKQRQYSGMMHNEAAANFAPRKTSHTSHGEKILFVGASTGGTEAIKTFLSAMPENCPPILVVQHMPPSFTGSFARRLDSLCAPHVIEAQGNERIETGTVYIAPGHSHLIIRQGSMGYTTGLLQTLPVNRHRPSVDVLFDSAANVVADRALGVILTGMGKDGALGLLHMRQAGARTFGQDENSCIVYGMPREAHLIGAVEEQAPLADLARRVLASLGRR